MQTSEKRYEGNQPVLLKELLELALQVVVSVHFQCVLEEDSSAHQKMMKPIWNLKNYSSWGKPIENQLRWLLLKMINAYKQQGSVLLTITSNFYTFKANVSNLWKECLLQSWGRAVMCIMRQINDEQLRAVRPYLHTSGNHRLRPQSSPPWSSSDFAFAL